VYLCNFVINKCYTVYGHTKKISFICYFDVKFAVIGADLPLRNYSVSQVIKIAKYKSIMGSDLGPCSEH